MEWIQHGEFLISGNWITHPSYQWDDGTYFAINPETLDTRPLMGDFTRLFTKH